MLYNTVRENEGQKKKVISMMRGVVVDLNQILWGIFVIVARLQLKQVSREQQEEEADREREKNHYFNKMKFLSQSIIITVGKKLHLHNNIIKNRRKKK